MSQYSFLKERFFSFKFYLVEESCKGKGQVGKDGEVSGIKIHDVKSTKNQYKVKFRKKTPKSLCDLTFHQQFVSSMLPFKPSSASSKDLFKMQILDEEALLRSSHLI